MKIGIMTMHRVLNYGSALQAYALQQKLKDLGHESEIIDYEFPYKKDIPLLSRIDTSLREFLYRLRAHAPIYNTKARKFRKFYKNYFKLSPLSCNRDNIASKQFDYDLFMTGSDQVWNPTFIKTDTNFFLSFVKEGIPRVSYASSFAIDKIPNDLRESYRKYLSGYEVITVRENTSVDLVKQLTGRDVYVTCDPTLLLKADHYKKLSYNAKVNLPPKFLLVYILNYMYDPYPEVNNIIMNIHNTLNLPIIYLDGSSLYKYNKSGKVVRDLSPCEFIYVFEKASFVVTSSFHGTAFSVIFQRPFISILKKGVKDNRIKSLLVNTHCENSIVYHDQDFAPDSDTERYVCTDSALEDYRNKSIEILQKMLNNKVL